MERVWQQDAYTVLAQWEQESTDAVYLVMEETQARAVWNLLNFPKPLMVSVGNVDWNRDLSPWKAPKAFHGGEDFGQGASDFLDWIANTLLPTTDQLFKRQPTTRILAGYSLAGLFALWAVCQTDCFDGAASISGSLWFDGWIDFARDPTLSFQVKKAYLSIGDREKVTRNARMALVEEKTLQTAELMRGRGIRVQVELNEGGHFCNVAQRIAKGIDALIPS